MYLIHPETAITLFCQVGPDGVKVNPTNGMEKTTCGGLEEMQRKDRQLYS
jgi:hypothetical protein